MNMIKMNTIKPCMWLAASLAMASGCASQLDGQEGDENVAAVLEEVRLAAQKKVTPKLDEAQLNAFVAALKRNSRARGNSSGITQITDHDPDKIPRPGNNPCKVCSLVVQSSAYMFAYIELRQSDYFTVNPPFEVLMDPRLLGPNTPGVNSWLQDTSASAEGQIIYLGMFNPPNVAYARFQLNVIPQGSTSSGHLGTGPTTKNSPEIPMDLANFQ